MADGPFHLAGIRFGWPTVGSVMATAGATIADTGAERRLLLHCVVGVGIHMHVHSGPHVVGGICVRVEMRHPSEDHWNPKPMPLLAGLFGVDIPNWAKPRVRPNLLFVRRALRSTAE